MLCHIGNISTAKGKKKKGGGGGGEGGGGGDFGFHTCVTCKYSYGMRAVLGRRG